MESFLLKGSWDLVSNLGVVGIGVGSQARGLQGFLERFIRASLRLLIASKMTFTAGKLGGLPDPQLELAAAKQNPGTHAIAA